MSTLISSVVLEFVDKFEVVDGVASVEVDVGVASVGVAMLSRTTCQSSTLPRRQPVYNNNNK